MQIREENKLALLISGWIFFLAFFVSEIFHIFHLNYYISFAWQWQNKYIIFVLLTIFSYFLSLKISKIMINPIKQANKKLREYNHNLAHEIKTPLSVIYSNLELLEYEYDKDLIKSSLEEVKNIKEITDSLLFLSENSDLWKLEKVSFLDLLEKFNKKINLTNKSDFILLWNKVLLNRLISNLIENALKYKTNESIIDIIVDKNYIKLTNKTENKIILDDTNLLFDTFYKLDNSRNNPGFWLGLSIVKKIADLHKLKIKIEIKDYDFIFILSF